MSAILHAIYVYEATSSPSQTAEAAEEQTILQIHGPVVYEVGLLHERAYQKGVYNYSAAHLTKPKPDEIMAYQARSVVQIK